MYHIASKDLVVEIERKAEIMTCDLSPDGTQILVAGKDKIVAL